MESETPQEVIERMERLYDEGIIGSGRLRAVKARMEAQIDADRPMGRERYETTQIRRRRVFDSRRVAA